MTLQLATGVQAGISTREQLDIALRFIADKGGEAFMREIYSALEAVMNARGYEFSKQGRATLRELVNRKAVQSGWIYPSKDRNAPWRITSSGKEYVGRILYEDEADTGDLYVQRPDYLPPEEVPQAPEYKEGTTRFILVNAYERNREGREACIRHYGQNCTICNFNFERTYGSSAASFIHVHHLKPLAGIGKEYILDPVADLRPVCPNCHAVLHRKDPPYSIEEVRTMISMSRKKGYS